MEKTKDFYQTLKDIGIPDTRIPQLITALNDLHGALSLFDSFHFNKLKLKFNSLDDLFEASQSSSKKITFKKPRSASVFTPRK
jgi:hypothetical protein